ncbi:hypothetical protein SteCoe_34136 [Stentor coeruleus]|uniref:Uncharacterized protein n=1 Tax=Stentor coeruleus TaxID=5963 RepID=A0A1R2AV49_9CILI|nr:hypothetical protein SteCoe_34136 [Stentor coeruleus]
MNKYSDISIRSKKSSNFTYLAMSVKEELNISFQNTRLGVNTPRDDYFIRNSFNSPEPSDSQTPRIFKSLSPGISPFSFETNQRLVDLYDSSNKTRSIDIKLPQLSPKSPSSHDFNTLLEKIDKVIQTKPKLIHHYLLKENEKINISQQENEFKYFKILCYKKRCPMQVKIKMNFGKLITYLSLSESQPSPSSFDKCYNSAYFEISDSSATFKYNHVYLGIKSFKNSQYKIKVTFAKIKSLAQLRKIHRFSIRECLDLPIDNKLEIKKEKSPKNFIKENIGLSISKSQYNISQILNWEQKKQEASQRKKQLLTEKRDKVLKRLNKKAIQEQEEKNLQTKLDHEEKYRKTVKLWLILHFIQLGAQSIRNVWKEKREDKLGTINYKNKVRLIQKNIRRHTVKADGIGNMIIASNSLLFFRRPFGNIMKLEAEKMLANMMCLSANRNFLAHEFHIFIKKVKLIQKHTKTFLYTKKQRINHLIQLWDINTEKIIKAKRQKRLSRKESLIVDKITRNIVIADYYKGKWKDFREKVRERIKSFNPYWVIRKFLHGRIDEHLIFNYIPADFTTIMKSSN